MPPKKHRPPPANQSSSSISTKGTQKNYFLIATMGFVSLILVVFLLWPHSTKAIQKEDSTNAIQKESLVSKASSSSARVVKKAKTSTKVTALVLDQYPHDARAFTQGMEVFGNELYESTGLYGESTLRKVDLLTGTVLKQHKLPAHVFAEGITIFNNRIYLLTWQNQFGYVFDLDFNELAQFPYKTEGWGLTHDQENLIMSDGSDNLYFLSPEDFKIVKILKVVTAQKQPVRYLNELEFIDGYIYANIWYQDNLAVINPKNGRVVQWIDCSSLRQGTAKNREAVLNGIAYNSDTQSLYVTGKLWPSVFHLRYESINQSE